MIARRLMLASGIGIALIVQALAEDPKRPASAYELICFHSQGPVRVRFVATLSGQSVEETWTNAVDALFAFLDQDKNGELSPAERSLFVTPNSRMERFSLETVDSGNVVALPQLTFTKDEKVTKTVFANALRAADFGPITIRPISPISDSDKLSAILFRQLDADGDGRLSQQELRNVRTRLAPLDADEDEILTPAELLGRIVNAQVRPFDLNRAATGSQRASLKDVMFITPSNDSAVTQLLTARSGQRATSLRPIEFGSPSAFASLDSDRNGRLDIPELTAWLAQPPQLDLELDFPLQDVKDRIISRSSADSKEISQESNGTIKLTSPGVRIVIERPESVAGNDAIRTKAAELLRNEMEKTGRVEMKSLAGKAAELALFSLADRNANGTIDEVELSAAMKLLERAARCRVELEITDYGTGLLELLDANGDQRLTPRELANAPNALKAVAGPDGSVNPKELPRRLRIRTTRTDISLLPVSRSNPAIPKSESPAAPAWFTAMDRNGDGDVSQREFTGPLDAFRKLDRDGDGLISIAESLFRTN